MDRFASEYHGGLQELRQKGAVFLDAWHRHVPTETAPGHAAILTGRPPSVTGIVGNTWWNRATGRLMASIDDPRQGPSPRNLEAPTLGDFLKAASPRSRVVSLSFKDRAAILLGGQKADAAIWFDPKTRQFVTSPFYGALPPWTKNVNERLKARGRSLLDLVKTNDMEASPEADEWLWQLTKDAIESLNLGNGKACDLLAVSFSATDYIGHRYGPESLQMHEQMLHLDRLLALLIKEIEARVKPGEWDLILTSDHGVMPPPEQPGGRYIHARRFPRSALQQAIEKALQTLHPAIGSRWVLSLDPPNLYLNRGLADQLGLDWQGFLREAAAALSGLREVAHIYRPGQPDPRDPYSGVYQRSVFPSRSGDLLVRMSPGVLVSDWNFTSHGTPYDYDAKVPLVFLGSDFVAGQFRTNVNVTDAAPTLAYVLRLPLTPSHGDRILKEMLRKR